MKKYLLIDGLNFFIRSFTVNPTMDTNGDHVGGVVGFLVSLNKLIRENSPSHVVVIWDGEGGSAKRRSLFKDYKAGRKPKLNRQYDFEDVNAQMASFIRQVGMVNEYLEDLPVTVVRVDGLEADDVIAYMSKHAIDKDAKKVIVSSDKDFYQLLDNNTCIYAPTKKKYYKVDDLVKEKSVLPENFILMKCLIGDKSDNIAGLKGVGEKTVTKLFPFLREKESTINDIFEHSRTNREKSGKYSQVLESSDIIMDNFKLMQLANPNMNPLAAKAIRRNFNELDNIKYKPLEIRLRLHKHGIQLKPFDFFTTFKEQFNRTILFNKKCGERD